MSATEPHRQVNFDCVLLPFADTEESESCEHLTSNVSSKSPTLLALILLVCLAIGLQACAPTEPIRLGFIGSLSGRVNDLGVGALNGVRLAIDLRNQKGGIRGRHIDLVEEDDQQTIQGANDALARLVSKNVAAVVGPMTSAIAISIVPRANESKIVLISPTVSTNALSGKDDFFVRVIPSTSDFAQNSAFYYIRHGLKRIRVIYDLSNRAYSESWLSDFSKAFKANGGEILPPIAYTAGETISFSTLAKELLGNKPDAMLIIGTSVETALIAQELRKLDDQVSIATTEWAATDRLIALGGEAVEGIVVAQIMDHESQAPAYLSFRNEFVKRYGSPPGFPALKGFDAANVVLDAIDKQQETETLKQALLRISRFAGAQNPIILNETGDAPGNTWLYTIKNGRYVRLEDAAKPASN